LIGLALASHADAREAIAPDVAQQRFEDQRGVVDHLVPYAGNQKPPYYIAEFAAHPSFSESYGWRIYRRGQEYVLRSENLPRRQEGKTPFDARLIELEIPGELASLVYEIWANALLEVRYTRIGHLGLDGTTYTFSTFLRGIGFLNGSTWSPEDNLPPKWMVESGDVIMNYSRSSARDDAELRKALLAHKARLLKHLQTHGKH
jgi:hypothetical protein